MWFIPPPAGVSVKAWQLLSVFVGTIVGIITTPLPLGAVAILGLGAAMLTKVLTFAEAFSAFSSEIPWLIAIAYFLAGGFIKSGLGNRIAYAQWEDCGPFRTDHWQYVFGNDRPKPNLNQGAGLDVSPAVRDYIGMRGGKDVASWRFVEFRDVPPGPWAKYGDNNTFVQQRRRGDVRFAESEKRSSQPTRGN
jgi:hypothetical protein